MYFLFLKFKWWKIFKKSEFLIKLSILKYIMFWERRRIYSNFSCKCYIKYNDLSCVLIACNLWINQVIKKNEIHYIVQNVGWFYHKAVLWLTEYEEKHLKKNKFITFWIILKAELQDFNGLNKGITFIWGECSTIANEHWLY